MMKIIKNTNRPVFKNCTLREWIRKNRRMIDEAINSEIYRGTRPYPTPKYNDAGRRLFVLANEGLYLAAKRNRVKI